MTEVLHADIFFFISAIAVIVLSVGILVILIYAILILRNILRISKKARKVTEGVESDVEYVRTLVHLEGVRLAALSVTAARYVAKAISYWSAKRKKRKKDKK